MKRQVLESRFRVKRQYSLVVHGPDVVEVRHGVWNPTSLTLTDDRESGRLATALRRLDGRSSLAEISDEEGIPAAELEALVARLADLGMLEEASSNALDYYTDFVVPNLSALGAGRRDRKLAPVFVLGDPALGDHVARTLKESFDEGLQIESDDGSVRQALRRSDSDVRDGLALEELGADLSWLAGRLVVFAVSLINPMELQVFNRVALRHGIPWIHAAVDGPFLLVGPTFVPHRSPCYECLETRVLMNLRERSSYVAYKDALANGRVLEQSAPLQAVMGGLAGSLTSFEALNYLLTETTFTVGKLLAVYLPTMEFVFNDVVRVPGCEACGSQPERNDRELYFEVGALLRDEPTPRR